MPEIKPYTIAIPEAKLQRLKQKLELTDLPQYEIPGSDWKYGAPLKDIKRMTEYWKTQYNWRSTEKRLNELPHFTTEIKVEGFDPLNIHFIHQKSSNPSAIPLLFIHGWPGSFIEVTKILPLLEGEDGKPSFDVVAPSLPNYCFSDGVAKEGFALEKYAEVCNNLMGVLEYEEYVTQGGDWGFMISRALGYLYPKNVKAMLVNWAFAAAPTWTAENPEPEYSEREKAQLARGADWWAGDGRGYLAIQSTKPATIAFSFADSPVGTLAWIHEKLHAWSDNYTWTEEDVLTWVSLYLFSNAGPEASSYHYYEALHGAKVNVPQVQGYIDIPLGIADFPVEISNSPKSWWGTLGPVVWSESFEKGGHFAGWERPQDLAKGLNEMFGEGGKAEGVVKGRNGY